MTLKRDCYDYCFNEQSSPVSKTVSSSLSSLSRLKPLVTAFFFVGVKIC